MFDYNSLINNIYPAGLKVRGILLYHSTKVAEEAAAIAARKNLDINPEHIRAAAMLHDIGIIRTNAPGIGCYGAAPYLHHGIIGADMLRAAGAPEEYARIAERHTGAGLSATEIKEADLSLPLNRVYMPETELEKLICYADCFYSKGSNMERKPLERVLASMAKFGPGVLERFKVLNEKFS